VLASVAAARTQQAMGSGLGVAEGLNAGYHLAFAAGAAFVLLAALIGASLLRESTSSVAAQMGAGGHGM